MSEYKHTFEMLDKIKGASAHVLIGGLASSPVSNTSVRSRHGSHLQVPLGYLPDILVCIHYTYISIDMHTCARMHVYAYMYQSHRKCVIVGYT